MQEIKKRVDHIYDIRGDDEAAHSKEDILRDDFIRHVSENGPADLAEMATEVLRTNSMVFERWCA